MDVFLVDLATVKEGPRNIRGACEPRMHPHKTLTVTEYGDRLQWVLISQLCLIQNLMAP